MSLRIVEQVAAEYPQLLHTNIGSTCFRFLQLLAQRLRDAGHQVAFVVKTASDQGRYDPPGFGQHSVRGRDGRLYTAVGVSHDVLYVNGSQVDCIGSANYTNASIGIKAFPVFDIIPEHEWRLSNPPLPVSLEVMPVPPDLPPGAIISVPKAPEFPPRDLVGRFFLELDDFYKARGRGNRTSERTAVLHVDNEGLFVWLSEFMRHYVETSGSPEERYGTAARATLHEIARVWP